MQETNNRMIRNVNYDLMRVVAMIFVISIHTPRSINSTVVKSVFNTVVFICNGIFFMISGRFNLQYSFDNREDYRRFYIKRAITILFPYLFMTCLLKLWDMLAGGTKIEIDIYLQNIYNAFMNENSENHLWYMYYFIGFIISTPFWAKMLHHMNDWDIKLLFAIAFLWNIVSIYLTKDFGVTFSYSGWMLSGWAMYYFAGYFCYRVINDSNKKILYFVGAICGIFTVLAQILLKGNYKNAVDLAPAYVIFVMAVYTFIVNEVLIKNKYIISIIYFVSKYSFLIYMIHYEVSCRITLNIVTTESAIYNFLESVIVTVFFSLILAVLLDKVIISPIQRILYKVCFKGDNI